MLIFKIAADLQNYLEKIRISGRKIGFVPTMGALHQGHVSLIAQAAGNVDVTVCSIFVNPTQFNNKSDFEKYPKTIGSDIHSLSDTSLNILFIPPVEQIYPDQKDKEDHFDLGYLETVLEGSFRPGHFQGVANVMKRLLKIVEPDLLFMGQKDFQQCLVVERLLELMNSKTKLVTCPTIREFDGLAMSSRNLRLDTQQRKKAGKIYEALQFIKSNLKPGNVELLLEKAKQQLTSNSFVVDYIKLAQTKDFKVIREWDGESGLVVLVAAFLGEVRLIDNMIIGKN